MLNRFYKILLLISMFAIISGCGSSGDSSVTFEDISAKYSEANGFNAAAQIYSTLYDGSYDFNMNYTYHRDKADEFVILKPDEISGITGSILNNENFTLKYDDVILDSKIFDINGITPATAIPFLVNDIKEGYPSEIWLNEHDGKSVVNVTIESKQQDASITKTISFYESDFSMLKAEIIYDNVKVIQCNFSDFIFY